MYAYLQDLGPSAAAKFIESDYPLHRILSFLKLDYTKIIQGEPSEVRSFYSRLYTFLRQSELFLNGIGYTLLSTRVDCLLIKNHLKTRLNFTMKEKGKASKIYSKILKLLRAIGRIFFGIGNKKKSDDS